MMKNKEINRLVEIGRKRDMEVVRWVSKICERNHTHVDSTDHSDTPLDVTLGDLRGLLITDHSVSFELARAAVAARKDSHHDTKV